MQIVVIGWKRKNILTNPNDDLWNQIVDLFILKLLMTSKYK